MTWYAHQTYCIRPSYVVVLSASQVIILWTKYSKRHYEIYTEALGCIPHAVLRLLVLNNLSFRLAIHKVTRPLFRQDWGSVACEINSACARIESQEEPHMVWGSQEPLLLSPMARNCRFLHVEQWLLQNCHVTLEKNLSPASHCQHDSTRYWQAIS